MSLSHTAAEYMLSDALLPEPSSSRAKGLRLELPSDRVLKFIAVGLPLFLVSLAFAREFSAGELWGQVWGGENCHSLFFHCHDITAWKSHFRGFKFCVLGLLVVF